MDKNNKIIFSQMIDCAHFNWDNQYPSCPLSLLTNISHNTEGVSGEGLLCWECGILNVNFYVMIFPLRPL